MYIYFSKDIASPTTSLIEPCPLCGLCRSICHVENKLENFGQSGDLSEVHTKEKRKRAFPHKFFVLQKVGIAFVFPCPSIMSGY